MNWKNIDKKYYVGFMGLALIVLILVTVIQPGSLKYGGTDYDQLAAKAEYERQQYEKVLRDAVPQYQANQAASEAFLKKVFNEETVRAEVEQDMKLNQKITVPTISDSEIKIVDRKDQDAVVNYITDLSSMIANLNDEVQPAVEQIFNISSSPDLSLDAKQDVAQLAQNLRGMTVPVDAASMHKAMIVTYETYSQYYDSATRFAQDQASTPWDKVYREYAIINSSSGTAKKQLADLTVKYSLQDLTIPIASSNPLIKTAQAGWPVIDIWQVAFEAIKAALSQAFAQFFVQTTDKMLVHIEKNFTIASQLYYSNALDRHYSDEYLKKFVTDALDKEIIKEFLPQFYCKPKDNERVRQIFEAKARQNAAPNLVFNPADPNFIEKTARLLSDPKNDPIIWEDYYTTFSGIVSQEASHAADKEVVSDGTKSGRSDSQNQDIVGKEIQKTMAAIRGAQQSIAEEIMSLGTSNPDNIISSLIAQVIQTALNKFIFTPLGGSGQLEVYQETEQCLQFPKIRPIAPVPGGGYSTPPFNPLPTPVATPPNSTFPNNFR